MFTFEGRGILTNFILIVNIHFLKWSITGCHKRTSTVWLPAFFLEQIIFGTFLTDFCDLLTMMRPLWKHVFIISVKLAWYLHEQYLFGFFGGFFVHNNYLLFRSPFIFSSEQLSTYHPTGHLAKDNSGASFKRGGRELSA